MLNFDVYRLDPANARLWRGKHIVKLPPKAFGVLHYLAGHPGQLVTKAELFQAVWPETVVTDSALTVCIKELRRALRDDPKFPQYIETVHRRGYRFIASLHTPSAPVSSSKFQVPPSPQSLTLNPQAEAEAEACFHKAIEIARRQQAKSLELRAVTSLARLWQQQGKKDEARQLLAEIYGWFTEGFDTKDLQEAKALLEELA
jgi:DNA-binding winged helix-turn-helix (wHTH) protein